MAKITVNNPKNVINSKIGKNYFKLVGTGGPKGDKGDKGDTGTAATISAGTASSLPAGSSPTVTNSGTSSAAVFNFGIPKGDKGDKGDTGETGPTGPTGSDGQAATVTVGTVTTGAPGTSATVVNSGTTSAAVLDFTIPRGDKGESGSGTGDMVKADYDANNAVADAGGIASYVEANAAHIEGVNSLPATGADETLYLTSDEQKSTGSATGSAIQIQTDGQTSILDFEMQGNATQNGTPTPDAPVTVNTTTGENVVKITGKNLFSPQKAVTDSNNTETFITQDGEWLQFRTGAQRMFYNINLPSGQAITFKAIVRSLSSNLNVIGLNAVYADGTSAQFASITTTDTDEHTLTFTTTLQKELVAIRTGNTNGVATQFKINTLQLELGSTATAYEPYQGQDYELNLGKNLFSGFATLATGSTYVNGVLTISTSSSNISNNIPVFANTAYYLKWATTNQSRVYIREYDASNTQVSDTTKYSPPYSFTTSATTAYVKIYFSPSTSENYPVTITNIQLERGTQASDYAPYFTPIELAKIGTYQDRIYKNDGKWYVEKQVGKAVLTGAENWQYPDAGSTATLFQLSNANWDAVFGANTHAIGTGGSALQPTNAFMSDKFQSISPTEDNMHINQGIGKKGQWFRVSLLNTVGVSTVEQLKTWLASNNTTVYYALATPTTTEITNQTLIDQLDAIVSAYLPQGVVNISLTGTGAQGSMVVEYEIGPEINYGYVYLNGKYVSLGGGGGSTEGLAEVALTGDYDDLINQPTIPTKTSDLTNDSGYLTSAGAVTSFNGSTGAVTYAAPVTSVNGSTGAVTVNVPTKTSDLNNDSGFLTSSTGVTSVNGNTGAVTVTVPTATSDLNNDSGFISTSDTGTVSTTMLANGAVTSAKLGLTSSTLPSIAWDSGTVAGTSGLEGLVYADLVIINNAYVARSQTAWNANWQNIGTLPTGYRPKTQTIFPAIFTDINSGNVTGYGRVRFDTSGVIDAKANATVSNAYCCFSGVFVTV